MWVLINNRPVRITDIQSVDYGNNPRELKDLTSWVVYVTIRVGKDYTIIYGEEVFKTEEEAKDKRDETRAQLNQLFTGLPKIKF